MRFKLPSGHPLRRPEKRTRANYVSTWDDLAHVPDLTVYEDQEPWIQGGILHPVSEKPIKYYVGPDPLGFITFEDKEEDEE
jgi:hypothetical protein